MRNVTRKIILSVGLAGSLMLYQNCSEVGFENADGTSLKASNDDSGAPMPTPTPGSETNTDVDYVEQCGCATNNIDDVFINVAGVYLGDSRVVTAVGMKSLLELSNGFNIILDKPLSASQIRLVLNDAGSRIVDANGKNYRLKVPSGPQSGLKINFRSTKSFLGNTAYTIQFDLDLKKQIVRAGHKCILKPVLQATSVEEAEF